MVSDIFFENKKYLSVKDASALTGYSKDYIGQLCRSNKILSRRVGRVWYVEEESLLKYKSTPAAFDFSKNLYSGKKIIKIKEETFFDDKEKSKEHTLLDTQKESKEVNNHLSKLKFLYESIFVFDLNFSKKFTPFVLAILIIVGIFSFDFNFGDLKSTTLFVKEKTKNYTEEFSFLVFESPKVFYKSAEDVMSLYSVKLTDVYLKVGNAFYGNNNNQIASVLNPIKNSNPIDYSGVVVYRKINSWFDRFFYPTKVEVVDTRNTNTVENKISKTTEIDPTTSTTTQVSVSKPVSVSTNITRVVNTTNIVERIVERPISGFVTVSDLEIGLQKLNNELLSKLYSLSTGTGGNITNVYQQIANSQRIDQLTNTIINNPTINNANINGLTVSGSSSFGTTTFSNISVSNTSTSTFSGGISVNGGCVSVNGVCLGTGNGGYNLVQDEGVDLPVQTTLNFVGGGVTASDSGSVTTITINGTSFTGAPNSIVATDSSGALIATGTQLTVGNILATTTATSTFVGGINTNLLSVTSTTASSTFANGINLTGGCFAINGTCLTSGGGGTPGGSNGELQYNASGSFGGVSTSTPIIGSSLSYTGTIGNLVGGIGGTLSLNLANPNTWTGLQTFNYSSTTGASFNYASSTNLFAGTLNLPSLSTGGLAVNSAGQVYSYSTSTWSFASSTLLSDANTWSGANTFNALTTLNYSSTTYGSFTTASTTNLQVGSFTLSTTTAGLLRTNSSGVTYVDTTSYQPAGTYLTGIGSGYSTTTATSVAFSTTTGSFNGLTTGLTVIPSAGALTLTPTITGTLNNAGLTNSTISGISLGGTLGALTATDSTLTFSGSYDGSTARTVGLNLSNPNTWTGLQTFNYSSTTGASFNYASSTNLFAGTLNLPSLSTGGLAVNSAGQVYSYSTSTWSFASSTLLSDSNTFSGTNRFTGSFLLPSLTQGFAYLGSGGQLNTIASSSINLSWFNNDAGFTNYAFPFTVNTGYNSTSTTIGFTQGLFSTASSTFSGTLNLPSLSNGNLAVYGGVVGSYATTTAGTGLAYSGNAFNVNTTQNITNLSNLSSNGVVYTSGGTGSLQTTATSSLATNSSLSVTGTLGALLGGTNSTISLNLSNPNTWTGLQTFNYSSTTGASFNYASSTNLFAGTLNLPSLSTGGLAVNSAGQVYSYSTSTWSFASSTLLSDSNTFSGTNNFTAFTGFASSTPFARLSVNPIAGDTVGFVVGSSTATQLSVSATGFGTTTVSGLNISGSATSTSNVGFNITNGCYAVNGTCVGGSSFTNTLANGGTATTTFYNGGVVFSDGTKLTQSASTANFFWDETNKRFGLGSSSPLSILSIVGSTTASGNNAVAGIYENLTLTNSTASGFQFGNRILNTINGGTAVTAVGELIRMTDSTSLANTIRGLEVQAWSGTNTSGTNSGIATFGKTFGIEATTDALAGGVSVPAAVLADLDNSSAPTVGNAIRAYSNDATSATLVQIFQETSAFTGTGLEIDLGNGAGSFNSGNFINLKNAGNNLFNVTSSGLVGVSSSTPAARLSVNSVAGDLFSLWVGSTTNPWLRVSNTGFGTTTLSGLNISGSATSTSNVGFNITNGCYAVNGTCITGGGSSASSTLLSDTNFWTGANTFNALTTLNYSSTTYGSFGAASTTIADIGTLNLFSGLNGPLQANNGVVSATTTIGQLYGGTGISSYTAGDILYANSSGVLTKLPIGGSGLVLKVSGGLPSWQTDLTSGGGGGATAWSTTTDSLAIYPTDTTDVLLLGTNSTSTIGNIFEVLGDSLFRGNLRVTGNSSSTMLSAYTSYFGGTATSSFDNSGRLTLAGLSSGVLGVDSNGLVYSGATTTAGTGLTYSGNAFNVNTTQNITNLSNLSSNGVVYTSGGTGSLQTTATSSLATNSSLSVTGTLGALLGGTNSTISLNLSNPNTWTGLQTFNYSSTTGASFNYASSTNLFAGTLNLPSLSTGGLAVNSAGQVYSYSTSTWSFASSTLLSDSNTFSGTNRFTGSFLLPSLTQGFAYLGSGGQLNTIASSSINLSWFNNDAGFTNYAFPFTVNTGYNSTSTTIGFTQGLFSTASSTFSGTLNLPSLSNGNLAVYGGVVGSYATTTAGTGLAYSGNAFNVNTTQNITNLSNLSSNGVVYTSGGTGSLQTTATSSLATNSSLSVTGTLGALLGGTNSTISLNLSNPNTWTGLQTFNYSSTTGASFNYASSTNLFAGTLNLPSLSTGGLAVNSAGQVYSYSTSTWSFASSTLLSDSNTFSGTNRFTGSFLLPSLTQGFAYLGSGGQLNTIASSSINLSWFNNDAGFTNYAFPFTVNTGYNSTSTTIGFTQGLFSTASSTFSGTLNLPSLSNGNLAVYGGVVGSYATTTAGTGLAYSGNAFNVNTTQNITNLSNLSSNGVVYTSGGTGSLQTTATSSLATNSSLSVTGTLGALLGGTNSTISLNLSNPNTWTGLQTFNYSSTTGASFNYASSTNLFAGTLNLPSLSTGGLAVNSAGQVYSYSTSTWSFASSTLLSDANFWTGTNNFTNRIGLSSSTPWAQLSINPTSANGSAPAFAIGSTTGTSFVVTNAGRVGIGTENPNSQFEVRGSTQTAGRFTITDNLPAIGTALPITNFYYNTTSQVGRIGLTNVGGTATFLLSGSGNRAIGLSSNSDTTPGLFISTTENVGIGTTSPNNLTTVTISSSTAPQLSLSAGAGLAQTVFRNDGTNFYISTTTIAGTATSSISAIEIALGGFGTTTLRGLNISGSATSTSNVGFNITNGCYSIGGVCVGTYGDTNVNSFIHSSTTIPKTYTANNFTALQTFNYSSTTGASFNYASSTNLFAGTLNLPSLSTGGLAVNSAGQVYSYSTSTWSFASSTLLSDSNTFSGTNRFTNTLTYTGTAVNSLLSTNASGNIVATSTPTFGNFNATSTNATSTIAGGFVVGGTDLVVDNNSGYVGIGNNNPTGRLQVTGTPDDNAVLILDQGATSVPWAIQFSRSGFSDAYVQLVGSFQLGWQASLNPYTDNNSNFTLGNGSNRWRSLSVGTGASQFDGGVTINGNLNATNSFTLSNLNGPLQANAGVVSATTSIGVLYGGTGLTTAPSYGNILVGNSSGGYTLTATSSLGLQPSGTYLTGIGSGYSTTTATSVAFSTTTGSFNGLTTGLTVIPSAGALTLTPTITGTLNNAGLTNSTISGISLGGTLGALTATDSTLTFSGSYDGSTARTVGLNLSNPNTWTGLQTFNYSSTTGASFNYASSTNLFAGTLNLPSLSTGGLAVNSAGQVYSYSTSTWSFASSTLLSDSNTFSGTNRFTGSFLLPSLTQGFAYLGSGGQLNSIASSSINLSWFNNDAGFTNYAFPFTVNTGYNSTSTTIGFTQGLFSTASSTFSGTLNLPSLSTGGLAVNSAGQVYSYSTSTWSFASSTLLSDSNTFSGNNTFTGSNAYGTPSSITLTNATGLPLSSGITGFGTGVATALGVNIGTAGSFVVNGGALGTPSSGTLTNVTGLPIVGGTTGTLTVDRGGTGATSFTNDRLLTGNGTGALVDEANLTFNGSLLTVTGTGRVTTALQVGTGGSYESPLHVNMQDVPSAPHASSLLTLEHNSQDVALTLFNNSSYDGAIYFARTDNTDAGRIVYDHGANSLLLGANNNVNQLFLSSSGRVGIGSTTPFGKLSIQANNGETNTSLFNIGSSTASATTSLFNISNTGAIQTVLGQGFIYAGSNGILNSIASSSINLSWFNNDAGFTNYAFPFTVNTGYNSTSTTIGFTQGLFSTASSTFSGTLNLPSLSNGNLAVYGGVVGSYATTTAGTGLAYSGNAFNVNTTQNITNLSNLSSNGVVYTSGGTGSLQTTATSSLATNSSLSVTGTLGALLGGTNSTISLNLSNPNTWTGLQTFNYSSTTGASFNYASSTNLFAGTLNLPSLSTGGLAVNSAGQVYSYSTSTWSFASSTLLSDANTWSGANTFNALTTLNYSSTTYGSFTTASTTNLQVGSFTLSTTTAGLLRTNSSGVTYVDTTSYQPAGTYLTGIGSGYSTTTATSVAFSTTTGSFNGLTTGLTVIPSAGALTLTPTITGTLNNAGLTNSTISGISLGGTLGALTATDSTLTFSGSYDGSTARTVGLNLSNPNTWTGLQTFNYSSTTGASFNYASSTNLFAGTLNLPSLSTGGLAVNSAGQVYSYSTSTWSFASSTLLSDSNTFSGTNNFTAFTGFASSTPFARLSVNPIAGDTVGFVVGSSTATQLSVSATGFGTTTVSGLNISGSATSTSNVGFNITNGCYAVNGTCVGGSSFTNTLANGGTATTTFYNGGVVFSDGTKLTQSASTANFFWDETNKRFGLGSSSPLSILSIVGSTTASGNNAVAGIYENLTLTNSTASGFQFGNRILNTINGGTAVTAVGELIRMTDSTSLANTIRGLEVQAWSGTNTSGTNSGIATFGKTFGIEATTDALAGGVSVPAAVLADLDNSSAPTVGNAIRAYSNDATSATLVQIFQETSAFTGTGLEIDLGNGAGSFNSGNFINLKNAGNNLFNVTSSGLVGVSSSTPAARLSVNSVAGDLFSLWVGSTTNPWLRVSNTGFGTTTLSGLNISGSATSTSNVGFNITNGCYAVNGTCITGGGSSASSTLLSDTNFWTGANTFNALTTLNYSSTTYGSFGAASTTNLLLGNATFSTTTAGFLKTNASGVVFVDPSSGTAASSTLLSDSNTFSGLNNFTNRLGLSSSTPWAQLSINPTSANGSAPSFVIGSSTGTSFVVSNTGNIGIGTANLNNDYKLQIEGGNVQVSSLAGDDAFVHFAGERGFIGFNSGNGYVEFGSDGGRQVHLKSGSISALTIDTEANDGRLFISTSTAGTLKTNSSGLLWVDTSSGSSASSTLLSDTNFWSGVNRFNLSSTTYGSFTTASTTNLLLGNATFSTTTAGFLKTNASGVVFVDPSSGTAASSTLLSDTNTFSGTNNFTNRVGLASSTPWAQLSINPTSANGSAPAFAIGSTTGTSFVVTNAGRVGIGTENPNSQFEVRGSTQTAGRFTITDNLPAIGTALPITNFYYNTTSQVGRIGLTNVGGTATFLLSGSGNRAIGLSSNSDTTPGLFISTTENVGIGTTSPNNLTTVTISSSTAPQLSLSAGAGLAQWALRNAGGNFYLATTTVLGSATTTTSALSIDGTSGTTTLWALNVLATGDNATSTIEGNLNVKGTLKIGPSSVYITDEGVTSNVNSPFSINNQAGTLSVSNTGFGTTTVSGLSISGSATSTSNVGFNITNGCYAVNGVCISGGAGGDVSSVSNADGTLTISPTTGSVVASLNLSNPNTWTALQTFNYSSTTYGSFTTASTTNLQTGFLTLSTTTVGTLKTSYNGTVWVDTSSGTAASSTLLSDSNTFSGTNNFTNRVGLASSTPWAQLSINPTSANGSAPAFAIGSTTGTSFVVTNAGNVGIGRTEPGSMLDVGGTAQLRGSVSGTGLYVNSSGNVGIGTTGQNARLEIRQDGGSMQNQLVLRNNNGANGSTGSRLGFGVYRDIDATSLGASIDSINTLGIPNGDNAQGASLVFNTSYDGTVGLQERMRILNTGNVGIGTSTPSHRLTLADSTTSQLALSAGAGLAQWTFRNAGGNFYLGTTTVAGTATTSISALEIAGGGFGTTTLRGLNISGSATSTSNVGFNITNGCFAVNGTCIGGGSTPSIGGTLTSATLGSVLFAGSGTFQQDNANFFYDDTNNRLGLGTTTPWAQLSINPNGITGPAFAIGSSTRTLFKVDNDGTTTVGDSSGTGDATFQFASDTNAWSIGYNSTNKSFNIASSTNFSSNVAFTITKGTVNNVGIASTTPWRTLSVNGTVAFNGLSSVTGTDQSLCIDGTTLEVTTQAGDTCAVSSARFKNTINSLADNSLDMFKTLRPVSFIYNGDTSSSTHWGFIAEETASTSPQLSYFNPDGTVQTINSSAILSLTVKAVQEMNLNIETIASTTASTTASSLAFADSFWANIFSRLATWFGDVTNGIQRFFAKEVNTEKLCVSDGVSETCLTKAQLDNLIANASASLTANNSTNISSGDNEQTSGSDTVPPAITINGNNPAVINVGDSYADLGASVTDIGENGVVNNNLGIYYNVNGVDVTEISIDTSVTGTHTIIYSSTDGAGNIGTATRIVEVIDPNQQNQIDPETQTTPEAIPTSESEPETVIEPEVQIQQEENTDNEGGVVETEEESDEVLANNEN